MYICVKIFMLVLISIISVSAAYAQVVPATPRPHTKERLDAAKAVIADPTGYPPIPRVDETCPLMGKKRYDVNLDLKSGGISPATVSHPGDYCFALANANTIIYTYQFTLNVIAPSDNPFDLLKAAITAVSDFGTGAEKAKQASGASTCNINLDEAKKSAAALQDALNQLDPGKDSGGKATSVALDTTLSKWSGVPDKYKAFESDIKSLVAALNKLDADGKDSSGTNCAAVEPALPYAEAAILDGYVPARERYLHLLSLVNSQHVVRYTAELDDVNGYDVVVKEFKDAQQTTADPKTFHLDPGRAVLSASAGFLLTELQARSYSSRTAPDPTAPTTKTQNVLAVDYGSGVRPALTALLNYNFPGQFLWRQLGLSISAGPVFDISNGKADTSRFGFFGGASLRLSKWVYLTPGVHVGEFADFPQGFTQAGQVIPPNTGTPTATKRYTARFAFALTFKVKDLGSTSSKNVTDNSTKEKTPSSQPKKSS